ncbi:hypothetical protein [Arabiibacter massiliensis]|uniref:hypothetical protein n=1 Tax=Arabiibacter massiliensis TaxID=1870985 RepID=UPI00117B00C7|nr:hypothetical protein [Arabiibacter massiliensis]
MIKEDEGVPNAGLELVHDRIPEFKDGYRSALGALGVGGILGLEESVDAVGLDNFKLFVPLQDQAMLLSFGRMFCTGFPVE